MGKIPHITTENTENVKKKNQPEYWSLRNLVLYDLLDNLILGSHKNFMKIKYHIFQRL